MTAGTLPISDCIFVFGKVGIISWDASATSASLNDSSENLIYGAGIAWTVSDR